MSRNDERLRLTRTQLINGLNQLTEPCILRNIRKTDPPELFQIARDRMREHIANNIGTYERLVAQDIIVIH